MSERRIRLDLLYDGTDFAGWQAQPGLRTVQTVVEEALGKLNRDRPLRVRAAGRTDAGVHARGQVADALIDTRLSDAELAHALARMLPPDVRASAVRTVPLRFDARRDAVAKTYAYRLDRSAAGDPFLARYALHHPAPLHRVALDEALRLLPGRRDWSGFAGAACDVRDRVRTLSRAVYDEPRVGEGRFTFRADGFLNHMVRNLVGTLLEIGGGRRSADDVERVLAAADRTLAGPTAPALGLCLEHVEYEGEASGS